MRKSLVNFFFSSAVFLIFGTSLLACEPNEAGQKFSSRNGSSTSKFSSIFDKGKEKVEDDAGSTSSEDQNKSQTTLVEWAKSFIENSTEEEVEQAVDGYAYGLHDYPAVRECVTMLNDLLVERDNPKAIHRKILGLVFNMYGYEKDLQKAIQFLDLLIETNHLEAIEIKKTVLRIATPKALQKF